MAAAAASVPSPGELMDTSGVDQAPPRNLADQFATASRADDFALADDASDGTLSPRSRSSTVLVDATVEDNSLHGG